MTASGNLDWIEGDKLERRLTLRQPAIVEYSAFGEAVSLIVWPLSRRGGFFYSLNV